jgi:hypothetical protein
MRHVTRSLALITFAVTLTAAAQTPPRPVRIIRSAAELLAEPLTSVTLSNLANAGVPFPDGSLWIVTLNRTGQEYLCGPIVGASCVVFAPVIAADLNCRQGWIGCGFKLRPAGTPPEQSLATVHVTAHVGAPYLAPLSLPIPDDAALLKKGYLAGDKKCTQPPQWEIAHREDGCDTGWQYLGAIGSGTTGPVAPYGLITTGDMPDDAALKSMGYKPGDSKCFYANQWQIVQAGNGGVPFWSCVLRIR